jgi:rhomboid family GlyGly-CTERM serine protease
MTQRQARWLAIAAAVAAIVALQALVGAPLLRYDRAALAGGELWRVLTGHLVHLGPRHLVLNLAGLVLVNALIGAHLRLSGWSLVCALSAITISAGLWLAVPTLNRYVGLSGVLHGLIVAGALYALADPRERLFAVAVIAVIAGKLAWEQVIGPMPGTAAAAGGRVVVEAHLFGALGGLIGAAAVWGWQRLRPRGASAPGA